MTSLPYEIDDGQSDALVNRWRTLWEENPHATHNTHPDCFLEVSYLLGSRPAIIKIKPSGKDTDFVVARIVNNSWQQKLGYISFKLPRLRCLTVAHAGFLGGRASPDVVMECFSGIVGAGTVDSIMINMLPAGSDIFRALRTLPRTVIQPAEPHRKLQLGSTFEQIMLRHSSKHRKRLRWELRRLAEGFDGDLTFKTYEAKGDLDRVLHEAEIISQKTYHAKVGGLVKASPLWKAQLATAAGEGGLRAHFLLGKDEPLAFVLAINCKNSLHVLAMAYLPEHARYSPGKHVLLHAIERACADGLAWVDYGFGDAEYKRIYGTDCTYEHIVHIYGNTVKAKITWLMHSTVASLDKLAKRAISGPAAQRVKKLWRGWLLNRTKSK